MNDMTSTERLQKVKQLRESGMTYKAIGIKMGFSVERARQLYWKATRKDRAFTEIYKLYMSSGDIGLDIRTHVSGRTLNILSKMGIETIEQLRYLDDETFLSTRQVGPKAYEEFKWFQRRMNNE